MSAAFPEYYVYEHWRPDTNVCFYVGKGNLKRAYVMRSRRSQHHRNIQARLGLKVEVRMFATGLTEARAFEVERERIA